MKENSIVRQLVKVLEEKTLKRKQMIEEIWRISGRKDPINYSSWSTNITKLYQLGILRKHKKIGYWCVPGTSKLKYFYTGPFNYIKEGIINEDDLTHLMVKKFVEQNADQFI